MLDTKNPRLGIYAMQSLKGFAGAMIGIFIPVYLLKLGVSVPGVLGYVLVYSVMTFVFGQVVGLVSKRISLKWLMAAAVVPQLAALGLLIWPSHGHGVGFLVSLAALEGLAAGLYWLPLHIFFAVSSTKEAVGSQVGKLLAVPKALQLGAPLLAGLLAANVGFVAVFGLAAAIFVLSVVPLVMVPAYHAPLEFNGRKFLRYFRNYRGYFVAEVFENIGEEMDQVIWPLAIYLLLHDVVSLGVAGSLLGAGSAAFAYLLGKRVDRANKYRVMQLGAAVMLALWVARSWAHATWEILVLSVLVGLGQWLIMVPFNTVVYNFAREDNVREFILFREFPVVLARILVYTIGIVVVAGGIRQMFWLALVAYGFFLLAPRLKLARTSV